MATSGARGSMDNLAMMAGSIGQPKVRGKDWKGDTKKECSHTSREVSKVLKRKDLYLLHSRED
jgi:hypothetical protein